MYLVLDHDYHFDFPWGHRGGHNIIVEISGLQLLEIESKKLPQKFLAVFEEMTFKNQVIMCIVCCQFTMIIPRMRVIFIFFTGILLEKGLLNGKMMNK